MRQQAPQIGIALSGGTLKAATHVGVLLALERAGIIPNCIAGTSAGSLVGALYAHGYTRSNFGKLLHAFPGVRLFDYGFPITSSIINIGIRKFFPYVGDSIPTVPSGLLRGKKFERYIRSLFTNRKPAIPLFIVATDLISGRPIIFHTGMSSPLHQPSIPITDLAKIITGSCSLPGIFTPVTFDNYQLVDGAFRHYVPVSILREYGCKKIIAINLYRLPQSFQPITIFDVLARSFDILLRESIDNDLEHNHDLYVIEPNLSAIKWHSFSDMKLCMEIGENIIRCELPKLRAFLDAN